MDEAVVLLQAEHDAVPYESHAFPQSAPGQSGRYCPITFGVDAPEVSSAHVLEIGCSAGAI